MQLVVGGTAGLAEEQAAVVAEGLPCEELAEMGVEDFLRGLSWMWVPRMTRCLLIHELDCCSSAGEGMVPIRIGPEGKASRDCKH